MRAPLQSRVYFPPPGLRGAQRPAFSPLWWADLAVKRPHLCNLLAGCLECSEFWLNAYSAINIFFLVSFVERFCVLAGNFV